MRRPLSLKIFILMPLCFALAPPKAAAAPFCVQVTGIPAECIYDDAAQCRTRARQLKGTCAANPAELHILRGSARYCLVTSGRATECIYPDYQSCDQDAQRDGQAACLDNPPTAQSPDMFRTEPGRRY